MKQLEEEQQTIRQYLLGELEEGRRQSVEERFMTDDEYRDEVFIVEGELLEDYVNGGLSGDEQKRFLNNYLSAPRQEKKLQTIRVLSKAAKSTKPVPAQRFNWLATLAGFFRSPDNRLRWASVSLLLLAIIGGGLIFRAWRQRTHNAELSAELARLNAPENIASADGSVLSITLSPVSLRDKNRSPKITIGPTVNLVQLKVPVSPGTYQSYQVELRTLDGDRIVDFETKTQPLSGVLIFQLPARILKPNDYSVAVRGLNSDRQTEDLGDYIFRVVPQ